jgi:hypothetical protein
MADRRVAWFRCVVEIEDEMLVQPWLTITHALFEACLKQTVVAAQGKIKLVDLEGGQSIALYDLAPEEDEDV